MMEFSRRYSGSYGGDALPSALQTESSTAIMQAVSRVSPQIYATDFFLAASLLLSDHSVWNIFVIRSTFKVPSYTDRPQSIALNNE